MTNALLHRVMTLIWEAAIEANQHEINYLWMEMIDDSRINHRRRISELLSKNETIQCRIDDIKKELADAGY